MEAGGDMIIPYGQHIAPIFVKCHTLYQAKNLYSLYNVIAVFAETMKSELQNMWQSLGKNHILVKLTTTKATQ